jgi:large repetitive protein
MRRAFIIVFFALCAVLFVGALSLTGPAWSPTTAFKNNTLNCSWVNSSDTTAQNITLLRNGAYFNSSYENASLTNLSNSLTVPSSNLTKGDIWTCRITLYNDTASTMRDVNITILNSPPVLRGLPAGIFNASNVDIGDIVQVVEDVTYTFDANATDADNDAITYGLTVAQFCSVTNDATGVYSCTPTQSSLTSNLPTFKNVSFTAQDVSDGVIRIVTFNVTPSNDAPTTTLANQTVAINSTLNYTFSVADEESNFPLTFQLLADSEISNKLSLTSLNTNGTSVSFYYNGNTPDFNDIGVWNISINVTDNSTAANGSNNSRSAMYNFSLNITAVGRAPYFTDNNSNVTPVSGIYELLQGQSIQINITANDSDVNSTITFFDDTSKFNIATIISQTNTTDAKGQIVYTPTNADVGRFNVTITIRDATMLTNTTTLQFNITNVNDAPTINEFGNSTANTQNNFNASNLTAFANTLFIYDVNGTDPDTPYGDNLIYADNTSMFDINASTGRIQFTPTDAQVAAGSYSINITVTDIAGLNASRSINLTIRANSPPRFTATLPQLNCTTKANCFFNVSNYATDPDGGDSVVLYTINFTTSELSNFTYNTTSGRINFTVPKTAVGNYTINITITDTHGAINATLMNISINNTPEAPNLSRYNFSSVTIVETKLFTYELQATDDDFLVTSANEVVNFTTNMSAIIGNITPATTANTTAKGIIAFTPSLGQAGNYTIQINATDSFGLVSSKIFSFNIYPKVPAPNITTITPWSNTSTHDIEVTYKNATDFPTNAVTVNIDESTTVLFNVSTNSTRPLTYNWTVDGIPVTTNRNFTKVFGFFSAADYEVVLNVSDDRYESTLWTWAVEVDDLNRAPVLNSSLVSPLTVNGTTTFSQYFILYNGTKFIDPDDDLNSNSIIDGAEANTLTFAVNGTCPYASLVVSGSDLSVEGTTVGVCVVQFVATDTQGLKTQSGNVTINITDIVEGETTTTTTTSSGGGGGSSSSSIIPITKKSEKPKALNIIAPRLVTIYSNKSVVIPIIINNTWTTSLKLVRLSASSNVSLNMSFDTDLFEEIPVNGSKEVKLTVTNYRLGGNYEIKVAANVSDPAFDDSALVLLNSIEQSNDGNDVNVKVTFANDLVNDHPECQELNEVLTEAKQKIADGDIKTGQDLVEGVINGCKYLVSMQQHVQEKPTRINPVINIDDLSIKTMMLGVLAFVVICSMSFLIYYHYSHKPEDDI